MPGSVRPRKRRRPRSDGVHPACPCPICLNHVLAKQGFALPCCNKKLAKGEPRQRIHKTCFFAYARSVFEKKVEQGASMILMPEAELQSLLRCPRCRSGLAVDRKYMVGGSGCLATEIQWPMDRTHICETVCPLPKEELPEHSLFFNVTTGGGDTPPSPEHPSVKRRVMHFRVRHQRWSGAPIGALPVFTPKQRMLGFDQ